MAGSTFPRLPATYAHGFEIVVVEDGAGEVVSEDGVPLAQQRAEVRRDGENGVVLAEMVGAADRHFLQAEATLVGAVLRAVRVEGDPQDGVLDEGLRREERAEGRVVELLHVELGALQREGVDQEEEVGHFVAQAERVHALFVTFFPTHSP